MGTRVATEVDAWLRDGGTVITASDRAARAIGMAFHRSRLADGQTAWPAPKVLDWNSFVRSAWEDRIRDNADARLLLNPAQEQELWEGIAGAGQHLATLLGGPRHRLAGLAMDAHNLLCSFAPQFLKGTARSTWQQDAEVFSGWLDAFDEACRTGGLLSPGRLPLELIPLLATDHTIRPPLLVAGFDRILPVQHSLFDAWGVWREAVSIDAPGQAHFHEASDTQAELTACAIWCRSRLDAHLDARLLVITKDASTRRGEIERTFLQNTCRVESGTPAPLTFEFSLGIPLGRVALPSAAHLLLRWLTGPLQEQELDWLLSTGHIAASPQESLAIPGYMRSLRRRGLERTHWTLTDFVGQGSSSNPLPTAWVKRLANAQLRLTDFARRPQRPLDWAELVSPLLEAAGWPGFRPLSSAEYQAAHRWQQAIEGCGSLGFDGRRICWQEFLSGLRRTLDETLFAPQSHDAPIQIAGPAESAGLSADAVWFLGANEDAWPSGGVTHPLLPPEVQRQAGMPHASPQLDWELARAITTRLLASAPEVHFSFARQSEGSEARPSRLVVELAGPAEVLPGTPPAEEPIAVSFEDFSRIPFPPGKAEGGSSVLTSQSQCPFKAFATSRLAAQSWQPAEAGLTASQRGQLLHSALHSIWAGPPEGIRGLDDLQNLPHRESFVAAHVHRVLLDQLRPGLRERMPRRYLELEELRLTRLVIEWLDYEASRRPFTVFATEADSAVTIAGLSLKLRMDRVDQLNDGSLLVIDYKSGNVSPKAWDLPRPDDVQLPLYAGFALDPGGELGGLVFAKVRPGNHTFAGLVANAKATLLDGLGGASALVKNSLTVEQLIDWRESIEQLAKDFLSGRAEVDPREYPKTCKRCGLQSLCRVQENQALLEAEEGSEEEDRADE